MYADGVGGIGGSYVEVFSYEERLKLQKYLKEGISFKEINRRLGKD